MNKQIPPSGYYYPNRIARIYLRALEEVMGRNGLNALLNLVGLQQYKDALPPNNLAAAGVWGCAAAGPPLTRA